ncbi:50S ribosomal protein L7ae-like protein [Caldalkalibacillus salinus]|uniref:50S ribosomal protein L7ae-like protein n=1 Tax=Caldalkalibacillus salinus TaxID=2803787 RepID=UPI0019243AF4|nr:50S ribosomal protein L7ae-like protein [Caldalkalibacillus salinus]
MSYEKVKQAKEIRIGLKQTMKSVQQSEVDEVLIAKDADPHIVSKVHRICEEHRVSTIYVDSMKTLGQTCGIDVGAATVALKK